MKMEQTECSEMWAHKIQTPGNNPEESVQHLEHGENLKSMIFQCRYMCVCVYEHCYGCLYILCSHM